MIGEDIPAISAPLPWQADNWQRLAQLMESDRLPHALMLAGPAGTGKSRFALALARLLLCSSPVSGHNCGECRACAMSAAGSHSDFRWLGPEGKGQVIGIDAIRDTVAFASKTAGLGERKVIVLSPADRMNTSAANALLKCLEEPSPGTFILLVCHRLHSLPATIRSRCQILRFPVPPAAESVAWLDRLTANDSEASKQLLALAQGCPLAAESLHLSGDVESRAAIGPALDALRAGRTTPGALLASIWAESSPEEFLEQLGDYLRGRLRGSAREGLQAQGGRRAFALLDEVTRMQGAVSAGANPGRELMMESLLHRVRSDLGAHRSGDRLGA